MEKNADFLMKSPRKSPENGKLIENVYKIE